MDARNLIALLSLVASAAMAQSNSTPAAQPEAPRAAQSASAPAAAVAAAPQSADADRRICRTERPMGSLIPTRICKTAAQWEQERDQSRKMMQDMQQRTGTTYSR